VESDIIALETPAALLLQQGYKAIKISGGPNSVYDGGCPTIRPINLYLRSSNAGNLLWPAQQGISVILFPPLLILNTVFTESSSMI
ncbi:putative GMP synthase, partial [Daphnia magna]